MTGLLQPVAKEVNILRIYGRMIEKKDYTSPLSMAFTGESATDHKCPEDLSQYALHHKVHMESDQKEQIADLEKKFEELSSENFIPSAEDRMMHKNLISEAEASVIAEGNYDIVLCTCNECFSPRFRQYIQPVQVIIDEAAMAMEPECLAPVCQAEHVVLIGDHKQLQPIIDNHNAKENGLGVSLFERLAPTDEDTSSSVPFITLNVQYRMVSLEVMTILLWRYIYYIIRIILHFSIRQCVPFLLNAFMMRSWFHINLQEKEVFQD